MSATTQNTQNTPDTTQTSQPSLFDALSEEPSTPQPQTAPETAPETVPEHGRVPGQAYECTAATPVGYWPSLVCRVTPDLDGYGLASFLSGVGRGHYTLVCGTGVGFTYEDRAITLRYNNDPEETVLVDHDFEVIWAEVLTHRDANPASGDCRCSVTTATAMGAAA